MSIIIAQSINIKGDVSMKTMSNVDVYAISLELQKFLTGARLQKAFQPNKDTILIRFHLSQQGRVDLLLQAGVRAHITNYPPPNPKTPPSFPMLLRKYLRNASINQVKQHNFDRILEFEFQKEKRYRLVVELFSPGNIILLDEEDNIILPLKRRLLRERKLASHEKYVYPAERGLNPIKVGLKDVKRLFQNSDSDVIRTLARGGLGGLYAEEVILRSSVPKNKPVQELDEKEIESIFQAIVEVFQPLTKEEFEPQIIGKNEDVIPLNLIIYQEKEKKAFNTFNQAADEYYSSLVGREIKKEQEDLWKSEVGKYEKRLHIQEETLKGFYNTIETSKRKGDLIYANYSKLKQLMDIIIQAREKHSWKEISSRLKKARKEGWEDAQMIQSLDSRGNLTIYIDGEQINLDCNKSLPENAEVYYNRGKKAKKKVKGVKIAIKRTEQDLKKIRAKRDYALDRIKLPEKRVKRELRWFEKLHWCLSSDGFLIIAGRDATTNELVVKKHLEKQDIYLHSDIHGAPSVVVKSEGKEIPESTINEAASIAASFSSAWKRGYTSQDVYWVHPDQVSKTPQSGEFIAKGAFIIRGTRNYLRGIPLRIAVGIVDYKGKRIMAGPPSALAQHSENYVNIKPGYTKKEDLAKQILKKIDKEHLFNLEDVIRVLPAGKGDIE